MTLIAALRYDSGTILTTDTRLIFGNIKRDGTLKIEFLSPQIGVAMCGLTGATDDILANARENLRKIPGAISFDSVVSALSDEALKWYNSNSDKLDDEEIDNPYSFIIACADRMRRMHSKGYSEEIRNYDCDGSGSPYGEYILQNYYKERMSEDKAKELAAYTILETAKVDPGVGEQLQLVVFRKGTEPIEISPEETEDLKLRVAPLSRAFTEQQINIVGKIVENRANVDALWQKRFNFRLILPQERAVFQLMKPCRSGDEFTNNISALVLLIEQMNVIGLKKRFPDTDGSINLLEQFLILNLPSFSVDLISNFRDISRLRSTKFPIHLADSKFVEVVIKLSGEYPPKWSNLYLKVLNMYSDSLAFLLLILQQADPIVVETQS